jgi:hypothetical protein
MPATVVTPHKVANVVRAGQFFKMEEVSREDAKTRRNGPDGVRGWLDWSIAAEPLSQSFSELLATLCGTLRETCLGRHSAPCQPGSGELHGAAIPFASSRLRATTGFFGPMSRPCENGNSVSNVSAESEKLPTPFTSPSFVEHGQGRHVRFQFGSSATAEFLALAGSESRFGNVPRTTP